MQSKHHQSEKSQFAGQAKEYLQTLKQGLLEFRSIVTSEQQRLEILAQTASTLAREAAALDLGNLSEIARKLASTFQAFSGVPARGTDPDDLDGAIQARIEPLLWRSYQTLQGMIEMQEMGDAAFMAEDVEREVMAGMQPILTQLETQTCELAGVEALPAPPQVDDTVADSQGLEADLWSDETVDSRTPEPTGDREALDLWAEDIEASGDNIDHLPDLDFEGTLGDLPDLDLESGTSLADLEELFSGDRRDEEQAASAAEAAAAVEASIAELAADLDSLRALDSPEAWENAEPVGRDSSPDPDLPPQADDIFQPGSFEPLEDLEALFAGEENDDDEGFAATQDDVFSELETLTDIPAWAVTPPTQEESAKETWSSELPSTTSQGTRIEYFVDLAALEPLLEAAADAEAIAALEEDRSFDLAALEAFLERPAAERLAPTPSQAAPPRVLGRKAVPAPGARVPRAFEQSLKVPVRQMDNLSNLIGELVVNRNSLEQDQERLRRFLDNLLDQVQNLNDLGGRMQDLYERSLLESSLLASRSSTMGNGNGNSHHSDAGPTDEREIDPLEIDRFTGFHLISQEMMEMIVRVRESSSDIEFLVDQVDNGARNLRQITTELQENVTSTRMVPFSQIADSLPRAVRDIASKMNKQAKLHVEGRDTLVDKMILEQLYDPLTHLLNNAMTHGVEAPETRVALGKDPTGRIVIRSQHQGNQTIIAISDDGAGIDPGRIKRKAVEKGLISAAEVETLSEIEVYDFIFHPGFSTRDRADSYAGRGVGMDVVRSTLSKLRGSITIDSRLGKGTTFTIGLPLTLSIGKALCCVHEQARIAFPMDGVEDMFDIQPGDVYAETDGERYISWQSKKTKARTAVPFKSLTELLSYNRKRSRGSYATVNPKDDDESLSVVLLRGPGGLVATEVDSVIGEQEIVIKQIIGPIPKPVGVAGATVLGDGSVMAIADVLEIIDLFYGRVRKSAIDTALLDPNVGEEQETTEPRVLIVDDSITVRELLSMSFKKAGYRVEQARDGQEAWEKLRGGLQTDLIFCDIDMPRMDGLELLSRISQDEELAKIPMSMLTSRGADRHRQMAAKFGAKAYFTKPYLEEVLLDAANRMRAGEVLI